MYFFNFFDTCNSEYAFGFHKYKTTKMVAFSRMYHKIEKYLNIHCN